VICSAVSPHPEPPPIPCQSDEAPECAIRTEDWARALIARQLDGLGRLAEVGLTIAGALERQVTAEEPDEGPRAIVLADISLAYERVARAVRMTFALQSRLIADLQALDRGTGLDATGRKERVGRIVGRVVEAGEHDFHTARSLVKEARERLEHDDIYGDVMSKPVSELIDQICRDLGLSPDWEGLAQEAWAREEMEGGSAGSPLAEWMAGLCDQGSATAADPYRPPPHAASP
jgi:hypothetical protein